MKVEVAGTKVSAKGPAGELAFSVNPLMQVTVEGTNVIVSRPDDKRSNRALHGLTRSLIQNMVNGVVKPFEKKLEIQGVGYNASLAGTKLTLQVGFANKIVLEVLRSEVRSSRPDSRDREERGQAGVRSVRR